MDNQNRRELELIDQRNSQRQQIAELMTRLTDQDKKWTQQAQQYEQQLAAVEEHRRQQAETHRMEIEQLQVHAEETSQRGKYIPDGYSQQTHWGRGQPPIMHDLNVTLGYTLRIFFRFTLGFKLPVGDVNGPSLRHSGPVQEI